MSVFTICFLSKLGILKLVCLIFLAFLIALSAHTHFNAHWIYHGRIVEHGEPMTANKISIQEFRNEYEECRYNSILYTGISVKDSEEKVNSLGARDYTSSNYERKCPHPIFELFLVSSAICIFIVLVLSFLILGGMLPNFIATNALHRLGLLDFLTFLLASIFLCVGASFFWYSAHYISQWCDHKSRLYEASRSASSPLRMHHDDKIDVVPANEDLSSARNLQNAALLFPPSTKVPPQVFYLTRAKRSSEAVPVVAIRTMTSGGDVDAADFEVYRLREEQYLDLCNMRQMTMEKYCTVAVAFICAVLHIATTALIYWRFRKRAVGDSVRNNIIVDDGSGNERRVSSPPSQGSGSAGVSPGRPIRNTRDTGTDDRRVNFDNKISRGVGSGQVHGH